MAEHEDQPTLGEVNRNVLALRSELTAVNERLGNLGESFVTRREFELSNDSRDKDTAAIAEKHRELAEGLQWLRRAFVGAAFTGAVLLLVWWFTAGQKP